MHWEIPNLLARSSRPGYDGEQPVPVTQREVDAWLDGATEMGVKSIICLLAEDQLALYSDVPGGLIPYYEAKGMVVASVPVRDYQWPPMSESELREVWLAYVGLPKPVLVHCSAGIDRTGAAVRRIREELRADPP